MTHNKKILLVDDEKIILNSLRRELKTSNFDVTTAESGEEAIAILKNGHYELVVTDLMMEGVDGIQVLKQAKRIDPDLPVIILTGHGDMTTAIDALRYGAEDYLLKPCDFDELLFRITNSLEKKVLQRKTKADVTRLKTSPQLDSGEDCQKIIGQAECMLELHKLIQEAARVNLPVLIQGESGTGKELVAQAIHQASPRKDKPFIAVHCAALPYDLLESELFGHVKGAFTGAVRDKKGRFELADSGTIFLDEIGELDPAVQVKLLRVLQESAFERVGSSQTTNIDVRLISATNKNLEEEIETGGFRLDLFYRLCVVPITTPPLRERNGDITLLLDHFLTEWGRQIDKRKILVSPEVISALQDYPWPGNIREFQNVVQFSLMKCKEKCIKPEHLPFYLAENAQVKPSPKTSYRKKLDKETVTEVLQKTGGNKVAAAKKLGVSRATLYRFINNRMEDLIFRKPTL